MTKYVQKNNYDITQVDDEWIILDTDNYTVTTLNQVAGFCWHLLKEPVTVDTIIQNVQNNYLIPENPIKEDIETFILKLEKLGLVQHAS